MRNSDRPHRTCDHRCHTEYEHDESLAGLLNRYGHYFAHRIGGRRRGQTSVMAWLANNPDATQKELSEGLNITPASLSEVLMKLERKGYVTRIKDENDRRFVRVRLTEEGEAALNKPVEEVVDYFTALSETEQETLTLLLNKLLTDWELRYTGERMCQTHKKSDWHGTQHSGHCHDRPNHDNDHWRHKNERGEGRHGHGHH